MDVLRRARAAGAPGPAGSPARPHARGLGQDPGLASQALWPPLGTTAAWLCWTPSRAALSQPTGHRSPSLIGGPGNRLRPGLPSPKPPLTSKSTLSPSGILGGTRLGMKGLSETRSCEHQPALGRGAAVLGRQRPLSAHRGPLCITTGVSTLAWHPGAHSCHVAFRSALALSLCFSGKSSEAQNSEHARNTPPGSGGAVTGLTPQTLPGARESCGLAPAPHML